MNSIFGRRSIRSFLNQKIPDQTLEQILKAGMYAPSAGNEQAWEFIVIRDKTIHRKICDVHPNAKALLTCDTAIVVCGNLKEQKYPVDYWVLDCSLAGGNIMLEAYELGVGSVWLSVYPNKYRSENIKKILALPPEISPLCVIAMGYAAEASPAPENRFRESKIHRETW